MNLFERIRGFFRAVAQNKGLLFLTALTFVLTGAFLFFFYSPPAAQIGPEQPIPFSHRLHAGTKMIECRFCHPYVARSKYPGIPPVEKCLYCHEYIIANHPQILKEHNYYDTETPTPWKKVFYVPEHVLFNHERHIKRNFECGKCHGEVETMDRLNKHYFQMGFCYRCHQENNANLDCWLACHS
ncbi:MAG: cytochrome c3 family protein [Desulfococcaceae bacterium]